MPTTYSATTLQSRCQSAADYVRRYRESIYGYWIVIGKTTPWLSEDNPPLPSISVNRLPEAYGFWYVHSCTSVYSDSEGLIVTPKESYTQVLETEASFLASAKANKVYLESKINVADLPTNFSYRMHGLCTEMEFFSPPTVSSLAPGLFVPLNNVSSYLLDWVSVHTPVIADQTNAHILQLVREF